MAKNEPKNVTVDEGPEYGYYGAVQDPEPNDSYTVKGVTGGTANVKDEPKSKTSGAKRSE